MRLINAYQHIAYQRRYNPQVADRSSTTLLSSQSSTLARCVKAKKHPFVYSIILICMVVQKQWNIYMLQVWRLLKSHLQRQTGPNTEVQLTPSTLTGSTCFQDPYVFMTFDQISLESWLCLTYLYNFPDFSGFLPIFQTSDQTVAMGNKYNSLLCTDVLTRSCKVCKGKK